MLGESALDQRNRFRTAGSQGKFHSAIQQSQPGQFCLWTCLTGHLLRLWVSHGARRVPAWLPAPVPRSRTARSCREHQRNLAARCSQTCSAPAPHRISELRRVRLSPSTAMGWFGVPAVWEGLASSQCRWVHEKQLLEGINF